MSDYLEIDHSPTIHKYYNAQAIGLLGLVVWESGFSIHIRLESLASEGGLPVIVTLPFEWRFFKERSRPHWSLVFYSGSRLALVTYLVSIVINLFDREALGCNAQTWIMR
ncbi:hypothetical protein FRC19_003353, partial [Serendipita sp. 401]